MHLDRGSVNQAAGLQARMPHGVKSNQSMWRKQQLNTEYPKLNALFLYYGTVRVRYFSIESFL